MDEKTRSRDYEIRAARSDESAVLFDVHAAITAADVGPMPDWARELEGRLALGSQAWIIVQGPPVGYALVDPLPGLPGVYELNGGIIPARRRRGLGGRLLRHVQTAARQTGVRQLSCRVENLEDEAAVFLLRRGFFVEHEECLLELTDLSGLPPLPMGLVGNLSTLPADRAVSEFCRVYETAFDGVPWAQPYSEAEVVANLIQAEDLIFLEIDGEPVGVVWCEVLPNGRGRVEPLGIDRRYQGQGHGRRLLLAALHALRRRGASLIEIGLWRQNSIAMNLYKGLGFLEAANWYYLACDLEGLKAE